MNKQALTEALAAFDDLCDAFDAFLLSDADEEPLAMVQLLASMTATEPVHLHKLAAAARLVERLLPGVCEKCGGEGKNLLSSSSVAGAFVSCIFCHGSGQVWDEGIVEAVARAIAHYRYPQIPEVASLDLEEVRAVLKALGGVS